MIETERLLLRQPTRDDFEATHTAHTDPRVMEYLSGGALMTLEESWNKFLRNAGFWPILGYGLFSIIDKSTGLYVGQTGLAHFQRSLGEDFDPYPEAAWIMASAAHGKGYAAEAAMAAHQWFEANVKGGRTVCIIDPDNLPSLRLAERLGYRAYDEALYKEKRVTKLVRLL